MEIIRGHEQRIKSGAASLGDVATTESDCSSARKRGDLYVPPQDPWTDVADLSSGLASREDGRSQLCREMLANAGTEAFSARVTCRKKSRRHRLR